MKSRFINSQGVIQAEITRLAHRSDELKAFMADKTDKQKELGRSHLKTVLGLSKRGGK